MGGPRFHELIYKWKNAGPAPAKTSLRTMKQFIAKIVSHEPVSDCFFELCFRVGRRRRARSCPGQFCTIRVSPYTAPLFRQAVCVLAHTTKHGENRVDHLQEAGTSHRTPFVQSRRGSTIDIIGPLGNDFRAASPPAACGPFLLVAGGTGLGPIAFLANQLREKQCSMHASVLGCRTRSSCRACPRSAFTG